MKALLWLLLLQIPFPGPGRAPSGGSSATLSGSVTQATTTVDLTTEGTIDWIHWYPVYNRKATGGSVISSFTAIGSGPPTPSAYTGDARSLTWTDGTPDATTSFATGGSYINGSVTGDGFQFTAPADTTLRVLKVYGGTFMAAGQLTAHLSDSSASDYVDTTSNGNSDQNYTITYRAASGGQTLTISWVNNTTGGNVTLNGAALQ